VFAEVNFCAPTWPLAEQPSTTLVNKHASHVTFPEQSSGHFTPLLGTSNTVPPDCSNSSQQQQQQQHSTAFLTREYSNAE